MSFKTPLSDPNVPDETGPPNFGAENGRGSHSENLTEAEFLERELEATRRAWQTHLGQLCDGVQAAAVPQCIRRHPWTGVGLAAAAGFALAVWLRRDTRATAQGPTTTAPTQLPHSGRTGILRMVLRTGREMLGAALWGQTIEVGMKIWSALNHPAQKQDGTELGMRHD